MENLCDVLLHLCYAVARLCFILAINTTVINYFIWKIQSKQIYDVVENQKEFRILLKERKLVVLEAAMELEKLEYEKLERLRVEDPDLVTLHQLAKQKNKLDMANQDFEIANQSCETTRIAADLAVDEATESYKVAHLTHEQVSKSFSQQLETRLIEQEIEVAKEALKRSILLAPKYSPHACVRFPGTYM